MSDKSPLCKYTNMLVNGAISVIRRGMIMHILYVYMSVLYTVVVYLLVYGKVVCHYHDKDIHIFSLILNMEVVLYFYDKPTNADI
jgi:hypothetical protein